MRKLWTTLAAKQKLPRHFLQTRSSGLYFFLVCCFLQVKQRWLLFRLRTLGVGLLSCLCFPFFLLPSFYVGLYLSFVVALLLIEWILGCFPFPSRLEGFTFAHTRILCCGVQGRFFMVLVCETCGGPDFSDCFIFCQKCSTCAVHRYCLREVKWNSIEVNWHCESCCLKCSEITPSIYKQDLVANQVKQDNAMGTSRLLANVKQSSVANMNMVRKFGSKRRRRRLVLEDEDVDEDVVPREAGLNVDENKNREVQTNWNDQNLANLEPDVDYAHGVKKLDMRGCTFPESSSRDVNNDLVQSLGLEGNVCENISCNPTLDQASNYMQGWPLFEPVWSGSFCIRGYRYGEMRAHLSNTACEKVFLVARSMPTRLSIHVRQRCDVWPKSFQKSPPHGGHVALYFFPNSESAKDEHSFEMLLHDLISSDLALKVFFDDSELLVFPSLQLPEQYHCFHERYYIWGVFKNRSSDGLPHIDGNLRKGKASLHSSDHMPGKIMDSVDSLPSIISSPSLRSPTPDDIEPHGMVDSVKIKLRSGSEDSIIGKMVLPHPCLSHPQQLEPSHCEIEKLQRDEVTENLLVPLDMKTCYSMLRRSGLCEQDCNSSFELPVFSNSQDGVPEVGNRQPELGEVQNDTSNYLNLFPLAGEDLAVMVRMGDSSGINLELGLGRMTAKQGGYKNTKPLEPGRSLLC